MQKCSLNWFESTVKYFALRVLMQKYVVDSFL